MHEDASKPAAHPYVPNAAPVVRAGMLEELGVSRVDEFFADIPDALRLKRPLDLPDPLTSEAELVRHMESLLSANITTRQALNFCGAGCYQHHVPTVCSEVNGRAEFLTAYAGETYEDHGKFQALFEYASMMAELLEMDVVTIPTYDGFQATATALRMATRITHRRRLVLAGPVGKDKLSKVSDYVAPVATVEHLPGGPGAPVPLADIAGHLDADTAALYVEVPDAYGCVDADLDALAVLAHGVGALMVVSADPIVLGVVEAPASAGADIVCGDIQSLGLGMQAGGAHGGFLAVHDDPRFVLELPSRLFGLAPTSRPGEIGFRDVAYERTSLAAREDGNEWVGTAAALWGITAGVYLALLGPLGMAELGDTIIDRTHYAMQSLAGTGLLRVPGVNRPHFREFVIDLSPSGCTAAEFLTAMAQRRIFAGVDVSGESQRVLVCTTEVHSQRDIDALVAAVKEVLA
jgi:glycine dehydrogenase subunit 1